MDKSVSRETHQWDLCKSVSEEIYQIDQYNFDSVILQYQMH